MTTSHVPPGQTQGRPAGLTRDETKDVMGQSQSQSQSQSQNPILYVSGCLLAEKCPASTTDRARDDRRSMDTDRPTRTRQAAAAHRRPR